MSFHAVRDRVSPRNGGLDIHSDKAVHPTRRPYRSRRSNAMGEVSVRVLEPGAIAEHCVDVVGPIRVGQGIHVDLHRSEQLIRRVIDLAVDGLAPDDHELIESDCVRGSAHDVIEVFAAQLPDLRKDLSPLSLGQGAGERRRLSQISHLPSISAQRTPHFRDWPG